MTQFIPFDKLSKKEKRRRNNEKRKTWGTLNPVTRVPNDSKIYNRNKRKQEDKEYEYD